MKKFFLIAFLLYPFTSYTTQSDYYLFPVVMLPIQAQVPGRVHFSTSNAPRRIEQLAHALKRKQVVLFVHAHEDTIISALPRMGVCARVLSLSTQWTQLRMDAFVCEQATIDEFVYENSILHARVRINAESSPSGSPYGDGEQEGSPENKKKDYREQLKELPLKAEHKQEISDQIEMLERTNQQSPEYPMLKRYLDLLFSLPWNIKTEDKLDIKHVQEILDRDHHGLEKVKNDILDFISVRKLNPSGNGKILCLVGPPGTGKTSICRSIAESLGRKYARIALGGVHDEAEIRGHRRTYIGALPGRLIQGIKTAGSHNPVIVLDEIDKVGMNAHHGDPTSALLEALDPEQNKEFYDNYLSIPFDLSQVMFITTANNLDTIPAPLRDRMKIIELSGYTLNEKVHIAQKHVVAKAIKETGLEPQDVTLSKKVLEAIVALYTREAGIRDLERVIKTLCEKAAREKVEHNQTITFTPDNLSMYLDEPKYPQDDADHADRVGVAHGLAWTPVGGCTLTIETVLMPGDGKLQLTGKLGEVMRESAQAALSYAKAHADQLGIDKELFKTKDIHIHAPAGAVPKDGPSAGITILSAVLSAFTQKPINGNYAMTGEINLHGDILPIGGVKEKILAAKQHNFTHVIIPYKNMNKVKRLSNEITDDITIIYVKHACEAIEKLFALPERTTRSFWPLAV